MLPKWLKASEATQVGTALADDFVLQTGSGAVAARSKEAQEKDLQRFLQKFLQRVDRDASPLQLNFFKRAKLANSFKWRLLEKGVEKQIVDELTQALVVRLSANLGSAAHGGSVAAASARSPARDPRALLTQGAEQLARGAYTEAMECYQQLVNLDPRNAQARNGLGIALAQLGRFGEAEDQLRRAIGIKPALPEPHFNLAGVLQLTGRHHESEMPLRRALKLRPAYLEARVSLGMSLVLLNRLPEARDCYEKALRVAPRNTQALVGLGQIDALEGRFDAAESAYRRALELEPGSTFAWASQVWLRRMTPADHAWLKRAEELAAGKLTLADEASLRFAMGKYCDDVADFARAFRNYQRGNELQRMRAQPYDREAHSRFVDDLVRIYTPEALARPPIGASQSERPVFVVGMPRSGTSLVEQIIASHPAVHGAGELEFWLSVVRKHETALRQGLPSDRLRSKLASDYLSTLAGHPPEATRVIDKAPINSDLLGIVHSVFPRARMIYLRRDPIDSCLSCYFQQFSPTMNFTTDLADLAHYYREHARLFAHWRRTLPPGTLLEVPYAELVGDQEKWSRTILEFVGLPWDERCLDFHKTVRAVTTASVWQVRQKIYTTSVGRWRNYQKFIGPLLSLRDADA